MGRFLKWWLLVSLIVLGCIYAWHLGTFVEIWEKDSSKLSFVIMALFAWVSLWCGLKTWKCSRLLKEMGGVSAIALKPMYKSNDRVTKLADQEEVGWFASEMCLNIGMVGTVLGFILMLHGFATTNVNDVKNIQDMLSSMSAGMSTALYTTLVGLICSQLLKIQYFNLARGIESIKHELETT